MESARNLLSKITSYLNKISVKYQETDAYNLAVNDN